MRIGQVAAAAGVGVETLRYYERRGLLPNPPRTGSGYRAYGGGAVARVRFIRRAQDLGFTLAEIGDLLALRDDQDINCAHVRKRANSKIAQVDGKVRDLLAIRDRLVALVERCREGESSTCPIIEAFEDR
ncbi:heavy metal-responsive transcriptional regulator [bacterium]|nr:heavy metal-responsive transcriptional regulator [bacterium]